MCSGTLGANSAGGPGETCPVLECLPAGSWREGPKLWPQRYFISTQSHTGLLRCSRSPPFLILRCFPVNVNMNWPPWCNHLHCAALLVLVQVVEILSIWSAPQISRAPTCWRWSSSRWVNNEHWGKFLLNFTSLNITTSLWWRWIISICDISSVFCRLIQRVPLFRLCSKTLNKCWR